MSESRKTVASIDTSTRIVPFSTLESMNDPELIQATLDGNQLAFKALMQRYTPLVNGYLHGAMPSPMDTEDLLQEIFLSAYRHLEKLKQPNRIGPWLLKIARNKRSDFYRSRAKQQGTTNTFQPEADIQDTPINSFSDIGETQESRVNERELVAIVSGAIGRLNDKYRPILSLRLFEQFPTSEIARQLNLKESTVRTRLERGLVKLRKDIDRQGIEARDL